MSGSGWRAALLAFFLLLNPLAQAQFKSETTLQSLAVQVADSKGNSISGLSAGDFTLLEDGHPQNIAFFQSGLEPVSLAVLLDSSSSMDFGGKLDRARTLLGPLLRGSHPEDQIFLVPFAEKLDPFRQLTPEERLRPPPLRIASQHRGTALYDSLASALCHMKAAGNLRQAIVVITDGADQQSRLRLNQLIRLAQASNPQIFMVGFFDGSEYGAYEQAGKTVRLVDEREIDNPLTVFARLAKESGAESFFPSSEADLRRALDRISSVLEAQYTLAYYPQNVDRFRRIDVRVKRRGARVLTRRGVGADEIATPVRFDSNSCEVSAKDHPYPWEPHTLSDPSGLRMWTESFSDPQSGWPNRQEQAVAPGRTRPKEAPKLLEPYSPGLRYTPGGYEIVRHPPSGLIYAGNPNADGTVTVAGPSWGDFRAEVSVETDWTRSLTAMPNSVGEPLLNAAPFAAAAGLVFHLNGEGYYAFLLTGADSRQAVRYRVIKRTWAGRLTDLVPWTTIAAPVASAAHKILIECRRNRITPRLDGRELPGVTDSTYPNGLVGFGVYGDGRVLYRDLSVRDN